MHLLGGIVGNVRIRPSSCAAQFPRINRTVQRHPAITFPDVLVSIGILALLARPFPLECCPGTMGCRSS